MRIAADLPTQMREHGVFETNAFVEDNVLYFSHKGTIRVNISEPIAITSVEDILFACFPKKKGGVGYDSKPTTLEEVVPEHMISLKAGIEIAQEKVKRFDFYKR